MSIMTFDTHAPFWLELARAETSKSN